MTSDQAIEVGMSPDTDVHVVVVCSKCDAKLAGVHIRMRGWSQVGSAVGALLRQHLIDVDHSKPRVRIAVERKDKSPSAVCLEYGHHFVVVVSNETKMYEGECDLCGMEVTWTEAPETWVMAGARREIDRVDIRPFAV